MNGSDSQASGTALPPPIYLEHVSDVLAMWLEWRAAGEVALAIVTRTLGGGVRAPGAMMAVAADGRRAGYVSGGCIDADVALQAQAALRSGRSRLLRYGSGSPYLDLPLPCGGMIELMIVPFADPVLLGGCKRLLDHRRPASLAVTEAGALTTHLEAGQQGFAFRHLPKLRLRIAARGADGLALARLAHASGMETDLQLRDGREVEEAARLGFDKVTPLGAPTDLPPLADDPWSAFVLAFHDADWEDALLAQALSGEAFYVGAVGSRSAHARRRERLRRMGVSDAAIATIHAPAGLTASMKDASLVALSVLAEVAETFERRARRYFASTALILLAAGQSSRFGEDKLLAPYRGRPLLAHAAASLRHAGLAARLAVVAPGQERRAALLREAGWTVAVNERALDGQATSLACGIGRARAIGNVESAVVLLGDVPHVADTHLIALRENLLPGRDAVLSRTAAGVAQPPSAFARSAFDRLTRLTGDGGAKAALAGLAETGFVPIDDHEAADIDTPEALERLESRAEARPRPMMSAAGALRARSRSR